MYKCTYVEMWRKPKNQEGDLKMVNVGAEGGQEWTETMRYERGERLGKSYKKAVEKAEGSRREEGESIKTCFLQKWHNDI